MAISMRAELGDFQLIGTTKGAFIRCAGIPAELEYVHAQRLLELLLTEAECPSPVEPAEWRNLRLFIDRQRDLALRRQILKDGAQHSIIDIALRNRSRLLLVGNGLFGNRVSKSLATALPEYEQSHFALGMSQTSSEALRARYEDSHGFPHLPLWALSYESNVEPILDFNGVRLVIVIADSVAYEVLFDLLARLKGTGAPVLPVTFSSRGIEIGPLILDECIGALMTSRFELAGQKDVSGHSVGLFSTGSLPIVSEEAIERASALIVRIAARPHQNDWLRWTIVRPGGNLENYAVAFGDRVGLHRLSSSTWGIHNFLDDSIVGNEDLWQELLSEIRKGSLISIQDAFRKDFAESVHHALDNSDAWTVHEHFRDDFFCHHHNIYDMGSYNATLLLTKLVFNSEATVRWIGDLAGIDCSEPATSSASWYMAGDHSTPHSDFVNDRLVAFVWHLTKQWSRRWGGHLVWCPTGHCLPPSFNTLNLFDTRRGQCHFVMTVAPHAQGKRLTWNGWWRGKDSTKIDHSTNFRSLENDRIRVFPH